MDLLLPGTEVKARDLRWEIVLSQTLGCQTLYRLRGLEGAVRGHELDVLHPFEKIDPVRHALEPQNAAPLRNWLVYHQAFLLEQSLGKDAFLATRPGRLQIQAYQLVPVLRAIRSNRVRLLLADGVGLGKTIQAGLILTEMMARRLAHRVLVVSPAGPLLDQWKTEMRERFSIRLDVVDRIRLEEIRRSTETGANPFDFVALGLASIDFLKQEKILDQLERATYDVIVLDEAHHCFDLGNAEEREDSQRRRLAQVLARRCDALLLLTATPHDGNERSFASLCELLDPSLVDIRGELVGERFKRHVIRRLKGHIRDPHTGEMLFRERRVLPRPVQPRSEDAEFRELITSLRALISPELRRAFRTRHYSDVLSFIALLKRSVSTVAACESTLHTVAERIGQKQEPSEVKRERLRTLRDYYRRLERFGPTSAEEDRDRELLEAEDLASRLVDLQREFQREGRLLGRSRTISVELQRLAHLASQAKRRDPKLRALASEIEEIRRAEPHANVLVYTEYVTSQKVAAEALEDLGQVLTMSGEDDDQTRSNITDTFRRRDGLILVSTDAAAEGLNLHERCHHLIHLELPFNPNRLEQRNGRIDRFGQTRDPIVRYLYLANSFEERVLLRLIAKYERQRARLSFMPNTLGLTTSTDVSTERLLGGLMNEDALPFDKPTQEFQLFEGNENEGADEATREILEAEDRVLSGFETATRRNSWLGDSGIGADAQNLTEADYARSAGNRASFVDLASFVRDAVLLEQGDIVGAVTDPVFTLLLPGSWTHGLDDYPGFEPEARRFRLTADMNTIRDSNDRPVGYLGRAHPLVRMALERVRNLSLGVDAEELQDIRVSGVAGPVQEPTVLYTMIGRVNSRLGRELERVLAVLVPKSGEPRVYEVPEHWLPFTSGTRVNVRDLWNNKFQAWAELRDELAVQLARESFSAIAQQFIEHQTEQLRTELAFQQDWITERSREIAVTRQPVAVQTGLFSSDEATTQLRVQEWASITDPLARLEAFSKDPSQPASNRSEAEVALRVHRSRVEDLKSKLDFQPPEVIKLGLLMIVPEVHGAA